MCEPCGRSPWAGDAIETAMRSSGSLDKALRRKEPTDPSLAQIALETKRNPAFHWRGYQGPDNNATICCIACELPGRQTGLLAGSLDHFLARIPFSTSVDKGI